MEIVEEVVIVGAGIAGLATAVGLKRVGVRTLVLERSDKLRLDTGAAINLLPNAWHALDALGVSHKLTSIYAPIKKGSVTDVGTGTTQELSWPIPNGNGVAPRSVHRKTLIEVLENELPVDTIRFSSKLVSIETQEQEGSSIPIIHLEDGTIIKAKVLIGCDGVRSVVARWLGLAAPVDSGRTAVRGLAVFPQGHGLKQEIHHFVDECRGGGFATLNDKDVACFFAWKSPPKSFFSAPTSPPKEEKVAQNPEQIQKEVIENYAKHYPSSFLDMVKHYDLSTVTWGQLMFRYPWDIVFGNLSKGNITIAGDAMHPMTSDIGQGGPSALEDAVVLSRHIGLSFIKNGKIVAKEMPQAIEGYLKERKWRVAKLVTLAYLTGLVLQGGSNWFMKFFRYVFYKFLYTKIPNAVHHDCGKLPTASLRESDNSSKISGSTSGVFFSI